MRHQSTKTFDGFSVALRQHKASHSHCSLLHGYALKFTVIFEPIDGKLDEMNWVQDYGSFKRNGLKDWLNEMFDHTTLIEKDDPMKSYFEMMQAEKIAKVHFLDKMGAESLAKMVYDKFNERLSKIEGGRVKVVSVECHENDKNSAIYKA